MRRPPAWSPSKTDADRQWPFTKECCAYLYICTYLYSYTYLYSCTGMYSCQFKNYTIVPLLIRERTLTCQLKIMRKRTEFNTWRKYDSYQLTIIHLLCSVLVFIGLHGQWTYLHTGCHHWDPKIRNYTGSDMSQWCSYTLNSLSHTCLFRIHIH